MAKADPSAKWYRDQLARAKERRAAAAALRPPRPPGLRKSGRYKAYNREWMRAHYGHKPRVPKPPKPPRPATATFTVTIPSAPTGHALYDEARAALRSYERHELGSEMDSDALDLIGEYVLAALEGRDPLEAMAAFRRSWQKRRAISVSFHEPAR